MSISDKTDWLILGSLGFLLVTSACRNSDQPVGAAASSEAYEVIHGEMNYLAIRGIDRSAPSQNTSAVSVIHTDHELSLIRQTAKDLCQLKGFREVASHSHGNAPETGSIHYIYQLPDGKFVDHQFEPQDDELDPSSETHPTQIFTSLQCAQKISDPVNLDDDTDLVQVKNALNDAQEDLNKAQEAVRELKTDSMNELKAKLLGVLNDLKDKMQIKKNSGSLWAGWMVKKIQKKTLEATSLEIEIEKKINQTIIELLQSQLEKKTSLMGAQKTEFIEKVKKLMNESQSFRAIQSFLAMVENIAMTENNLSDDERSDQDDGYFLVDKNLDPFKKSGLSKITSEQLKEVSLIAELFLSFLSQNEIKKSKEYKALEKLSKHCESWYLWHRVAKIPYSDDSIQFAIKQGQHIRMYDSCLQEINRIQENIDSLNSLGNSLRSQAVPHFQDIQNKLKDTCTQLKPSELCN